MREGRTLDLLALGRISVDLYAQEPGASFLQPQTFVKSVGGSPSNVAVAGARLGLRSAVVTAVGADPLGEYAVAKLEALGVDTRYVAVREEGRTPVVLVALEDPGEPTITFLRDPHAPDTTIEPDAVDAATVADAAVLWTSGATLAAGSTAGTAMRWLEQRGRRSHTVLDLDHRPGLWADPSEATAAAARAIELSSVVIGNRTECAMALGALDPHGAADALLARGVSLAVVKMGGDGVLLASAEERVVVAPIPVTVRCGSGAGDAFGGALALGLVRGWTLERIGELANAAGALVTSRLTCADAMPSLPELETFLAGRRSSVQGSRAAKGRGELSDTDFHALTEARVREPHRLRKALAERPRRPLVGPDGRMFLLAADHTSRGKLAIGSHPMAAADRRSLLDRILTGLADPRVDGVLGSADVLEELALLGALDGRLAVGTMNRGGIAGAHWELDDRVTAYDAEHVVSMGLDGGKMLLRFEPTDPGVPRTLETVARLTTALADASTMALVEPLPYRRRPDGAVELDPSEEALVRMVAIASGLGSSSSYTWLKVPATADPGRVAAASTCPVLLLGGDAGRDHEKVFQGWERALRVPSIRGLVPGRAVLYPEVLSVRDAVDRAAGLVHPTAPPIPQETRP